MPWDPPVRKPTDKPGATFTAWEDGHAVNAQSPEVGWYLHTDGRWSLDPVGGKWTINAAYLDPAIAASFGFGNEGAVSGLVKGLGKGSGGNMMGMFMGGATEQIDGATKQLRAEIVAARNAWCMRNGIPIPAAGTQLPFKSWLVEVFGNPERFFTWPPKK